MVKKIIACADLHFPSYKGISDLESVLDEFIDKCIEIVSKEGSECVRIVIAGDIFHNKINVTNESIIAVNKFLRKLDNICKTIVFAGNHDFLVNNTDRIDSITPLFEYGTYKQVVFLDNELDYKSGIYDDDNVSWCLYSSFDGFNTPDIFVHKQANMHNEKSENTYVGLIHGDVNGAITATNYVTDNGIDPGVFDGCDFVIAGHIHKRQEIKKNGVKVVYCSSLKQQNFGESISGHGFVIWDIEDNEDITYKYVDVPNEESGYFKFEINNIEDIKNDNEELINY